MRTFVFGLLAACAQFAAAADNGWAFYGGDAGGTRYSTLKQITPANVTRLKAIWTYHTGALSPVTDLTLASDSLKTVHDPIISAKTSRRQGIELGGVSIFRFDEAGHFRDRIEAKIDGGAES